MDWKCFKVKVRGRRQHAAPQVCTLVALICFTLKQHQAHRAEPAGLGLRCFCSADRMSFAGGVSDKGKIQSSTRSGGQESDLGRPPTTPASWFVELDTPSIADSSITYRGRLLRTNRRRHSSTRLSRRLRMQCRRNRSRRRISNLIHVLVREALAQSRRS